MYLQNMRPKSTRMRYLIFTLFTGILILLFAFRGKNADNTASEIVVATADSVVQTSAPFSDNSDANVAISNTPASNTLHDSEPAPEASNFVEYAKSLTGTPYLYGSVDPRKGLDCSGFINAVSNHFGIKVPRSSVEFTNVGTTIDSKEAMPGDLILFTGTDPAKRVVGHMGIVTDNNDGHLKFIHSSSGKAHGVTTSDLDGYYQTRFVKVIRIFPAGEDKSVA